MKWTVILGGLLSASLLAVAQDPTGIAPAQTNQANQPAVFPDTSRPQQLNTTNETNLGGSTNTPSPATNSTNTPSPATNSTSGTGSTTSRQITIIRGSDTSTGSGQLPPNDNGINPVKSTAGTPNDWRSGGSTPHLVPPRQPVVNP
jgi:hypothetical protein